MNNLAKIRTSDTNGIYINIDEVNFINIRNITKVTKHFFKENKETIVGKEILFFDCNQKIIGHIIRHFGGYTNNEINTSLDFEDIIKQIDEIFINKKIGKK